jgi:hypothetical protein
MQVSCIYRRRRISLLALLTFFQIRDPSGFEISKFQKPNRNDCFPQQLEEGSGMVILEFW